MVIVIIVNFAYELIAFTSMSNLTEKDAMSFKNFSQVTIFLPIYSLMKTNLQGNMGMRSFLQQKIYALQISHLCPIASVRVFLHIGHSAIDIKFT